MPEPRTPQGRAGLAALRADLPGSLIALDYDGTLAPIVARPQDAVPAPGAVEVLTQLASRVGRLALVTGRPALVAVELGGLASVPGLTVLGQYGVERWSAGVLSAPEPFVGIAAARAELPALVEWVGAEIEDKGQSLVVHTRNAPAGAQERLAEPVGELARRTGLEMHHGRRVLELRPPGFDKHGALMAVATPRPAAVLFAGDDVGDARGFDAVNELRSEGVPGLTVLSDSDEAPPALRDRADLVVDGPAGVVDLLRTLL
ncbi:MAG: trehalose 6-phosphate phosphatase [Actinomycetota bacterium]|nr:trehalose 6-phosphate phosphatase [Actinomycetota bacterium]